MRKRNHVIPVRLNAREVRELNEQEHAGILHRSDHQGADVSTGVIVVFSTFVRVM